MGGGGVVLVLAAVPVADTARWGTSTTLV
jgi:hypothetical protein